MKKNKILIISSGVYSTPPKDGDAVAKITYELAIHLAKDELNLNYTIFDIQDENNNKKYEEIFPNLDIKRIKIPKFIKGKYRHIYFHFRALLYSYLNGYKVIISNNQWGVFFSKIFLKKTIFISHSPLWGINKQKGEELATKLANKPISISRHIFNFMQKINNKALLIYNRVNINKYKSINKNKFNSKSILYIGKINDRKNIKLLIQAFSIIQKKGFLNYILDIVGPLSEEFGEYKKQNYFKEIKKYIEENNIKNITFHGPKKESELIEYYNKAKIFILPSKSEGMPLVLLEAMSCGTPNIANSFEGVRSYFPKESGLITFKYNELNDLVEKILYILNLNEKEFGSLSLKIRNYIVNNYSYEIGAKKYNKEIKKLLGIKS